MASLATQDFNNTENADISENSIISSTTSIPVYTVQHSCNKSCGICCETFTKTTRKEITCTKCNESSCRECVRTYILQIDDEPNCMWCKNPFRLEEIIKGVGKSFYNKEFKNHRKDVLFEIEKARFPDTMELCGRIKSRDERDLKIKENNQKIRELEDKIKEIEKSNRKIDREFNIANNNYYNTKNQKKERAEFIQKCPVDNCNGFLSTAWKCKLCNNYTCSKCMEVKGLDNNCEHTCNKDTIASVKLLRSDSKPCPKCRAMIYKISGCDQMWCTQCQVAFSWNTGLVVNGVIHNPHYYEWTRNNPNTMGNLNPGAEVCGGEINYNVWIQTSQKIAVCITNECHIYESLKQKYNSNNTNISNKHLINPYGIHRYNNRYDNDNKYSRLMRSLLSIIHRARRHNQYQVIDPLRREVQRNMDTEYIRAEYILNKISKTDFKTKIAAKDKEKRKAQDILHVYEFFNVSLTETIREIYEIAVDNRITIMGIIRLINNLNGIRIYCNECLLHIGELYSNCIKLIALDFAITPYKYKSNILKEKLKQRDQTKVPEHEKNKTQLNDQRAIYEHERNRMLFINQTTFTMFGWFAISQEEFYKDIEST